MVILSEKYKKKRNGQIEGVQSFNNKRICVYVYDEGKNDFVWKWVETPEFVKKSIKVIVN